MKAQILKHTGLTEKQFYAKYKTQKDFENSKEGKTFKKAQMGMNISGDSMQDMDLGKYQNRYDFNEKLLMGYTQQELADMQKKNTEGANAQSNSGGMNISGLMKMFNSGGGEDVARHGGYIPIAQEGDGLVSLTDEEVENKGGKYDGYAFPGGPNSKNNSNLINKIAGGMDALGGAYNTFQSEKKEVENLRQQKGLLDLNTRLINTPDVNLPLQKHVFDHPEDHIASTNMFHPARGTGYDVLRGVGRDGLNIRKAQEGFVEGMGMDSAGYDYYDGGAPEPVNIKEMDAITEAQPDLNQMSDKDASAFMETYNRDQGVSTETFDSNSTRDTWVQKTGMPWAEAKRLGYTNGSAKDNTKLLNELKDPRFKKENLRREAPKNKSQSRTPVQHTDTPTGRLTPIKKPLTMDEYFKGKPKYKGNATMLSTDSRNQLQREQEAKRSQAEYNNQLGLELPLYYMANPSKAIGDLKSLLNPMFTSDDETSKGFRKEVMANRYNPNQTSNKRLVNHIKKGLKLTPKAAVNVATVLSTMPYTTFEPLAVGIGEGAGVRAAGYLEQGAKQIGQGAAKQLTGSAAKQIAPGYVPNFTMYRSGGEIQNTYAPGYLYDDLGYDNNENSPKQYNQGGYIPQAQMGNSFIQGQFNNNAGSQLGNAIPIPGVSESISMLGGMADQFWGPAGEISSLKKQIKIGTDRNIGNTMYRNLGFRSNRQNGGWVSHDWQPQTIASFGGLDEQDFYDYAHDGMDSLRAGGHLKEYTPISNRGMEQYAEGGELKTHWGGEVKPVSYNPFSGGEGYTYNAYGQSHAETNNQGQSGIGLSIMKDGGDMGDDDADVEIETREPISITDDGAEVYGNLNTDPSLLKQFNLPKEFGNKKVKDIVNKIIVPKEQKINKQMKKLFSNKDDSQLAIKTNEAIKNGLMSQLKTLAEQKENLAAYQTYNRDTTDALSERLGREVSQEKFAKNGEISHILAKGEISQEAKNGKTLYKAQGGDKIKSDGMTKEEAIRQGYKLEDDGRYHLRTKEEAAKPTVSKIAVATKDIPRQHKNASGLYGNVTPEQFEEYKKRNDWYDWTRFDPSNPEHVGHYEDAFNAKAKEYGSDARIGDQGDSKQRGLFGQQDYSANIDMNKNNPTAKATDQIANIISGEEYIPVEQKKKFPYGPIINSALKMFDKGYDNPLDYNQIAPELYDLATNQPRNIYAPHINSMLKTPYKYSADRDRNAIMSQSRDAMRNAGNNPAAISAIMAQTASAMDQIGAKEAEVNQQTYQGIYNDNIGTVNQDKARNQAIDIEVENKINEDAARMRREKIDAQSSLSAKQLANKAETRRINTLQTLYPNWSFGPDGTIIKRPRYVDFDTSGKGATGSGKSSQSLPGYKAMSYDKNGNVLTWKKLSAKEAASEDDEDDEAKQVVADYTALDDAGRTPGIGERKNGGKVKAKNGSIVSAYKNL